MRKLSKSRFKPRVYYEMVTLNLSIGSKIIFNSNEYKMTIGYTILYITIHNFSLLKKYIKSIIISDKRFTNSNRVNCTIYGLRLSALARTF